MSGRRTFTAQMRKRARELHEQGYGCNAIARELEVSPATISQWAKGEGLAFDRSQTALAVRAHTIDLRADALQGAKEAMVIARDLLQRVHRGDFVVHAFGGESGEMRTGVLADAPPEAVQKAVTSMAIAIDKVMKVAASLDDGPLARADSLLDALAIGVAAAHHAYIPEP